MPRYRCRSQYLIPVLDTVSKTPSLQEILWNFNCVKHEGMTLRNNPHFYADLPTSPEECGNSLEIDPTEDFQHGDKFYVLTGKPELVYIMTDQVLRSFGNFWCTKDSIIFKGSGVISL